MSNQQTPLTKETMPTAEQLMAVLRECFEISRRGCFSRKRSERDKALSDINYRLGQFTR